MQRAALRRLIGSLILLGSLPAARAYPNAISVAPGGISPVSANVAGPGAVCPGVQFGNAGILRGPGVVGATFDGVLACSDQTMVGGKPIISTTTTRAIGAAILRNDKSVLGAPDFAGGKLGTTTLQIGQNFSYNRRTTTDKPNSRLNTDAGVTSPAGSTANATASIAVVNNVATGTATSSLKRARFEPLGGVAVGLVNDPLTITPISSGLPTIVAVTIGTTDTLLSLQASDPFDTASALYELAVGTQTLLSLEIEIDNSTTSLQNVGFQFLAFDPAGLGFGSMDQTSYLNSVILPFLTFDPNGHVLAATSPILVSNGPFLLSGTDSVDFTWNYAAVAGAGVPEPSTLFLILSGMAVLLAARILAPSRTTRNANRGESLLPPREAPLLQVVQRQKMAAQKEMFVGASPSSGS